MNPKIEKIAKDVLLKCGQFGNQSIDPSAVAEFLGVSVVLEKFSDDISGVLVRKQGGASTIAINKTDSKNRQRFTIAHECGHYVLKHKGELFVDNFVLNKRDTRSGNAIDVKEIEANSFAAALLMPQETVLECAVKLTESGSVKTQSDLISKMASKFKVSTPAMGYRLINLGIVTTMGDEPASKNKKA